MDKVIAALAVLSLTSLFVEWFWNLSLPSLFEVKEITYWESFGLTGLFFLVYAPLASLNVPKPR